MSDEEKNLKPEVIVFAGPNGSGKSTITKMAKTVGVYINADDIKRSSLCSDLEAAQKAEELREQAINEKRDFTFETVLSTDRNLNLLRRAKENGYFIRCIYVLTASPDINVARNKGQHPGLQTLSGNSAKDHRCPRQGRVCGGDRARGQPH